MSSKGSRFTLVVWGFMVGLPDVVFMLAAVRNRNSSRKAVWPCLYGITLVQKGSLLEVSNVHYFFSCCRFGAS